MKTFIHPDVQERGFITLAIRLIVSGLKNDYRRAFIKELKLVQNEKILYTDSSKIQCLPPTSKTNS